MKTKYTIKDIKKTLHKKSSPTVRYIFNNLSIYPSWLLINYSKITPNQISWLSFLAGLFAAWFFYQGQLVAGAIFFLLFSVLDAIDGKMAKVSGQASGIGLFLDSTFGSITFSINILALGIGQFRLTNQPIFLILGLALLFIHYIMAGLSNAREGAYIEEEGKEAGYSEKERLWEENREEAVKKSQEYSFLGKLKEFKDYLERKDIYPRFTGDEVCLLVFLIGPIFNLVKETFIIAIVLYFLTFILHFTLVSIDLYRLKSKRS